MIIEFSKHRKVGSGVYADVFAVGLAAYKLFKSGPEVPPRQTRDGRRRVFWSQCEAFELANEDPWLRNHVAAFTGIYMIHDVIDGNGMSAQHSYLLDCCYGIELFGPDENDLKATSDVVRSYDHIQEARQLFRNIGIATSDSSVFRYSDPQEFKFIDIEMEG